MGSILPIGWGERVGEVEIFEKINHTAGEVRHNPTATSWVDVYRGVWRSEVPVLLFRPAPALWKRPDVGLSILEDLGPHAVASGEAPGYRWAAVAAPLGVRLRALALHVRIPEALAREVARATAARRGGDPVSDTFVAWDGTLWFCPALPRCVEAEQQSWTFSEVFDALVVDSDAAYRELLYNELPPALSATFPADAPRPTTEAIEAAATAPPLSRTAIARFVRKALPRLFWRHLEAHRSPHLDPPPPRAPPPTKRPSTHRQLVEAVWEAPDDDAPRFVYGDWLAERGDPYGRLIQLQCRPAPTPAQRTEIAALLSRGEPRWVGPLLRALKPDPIVFARGFPSVVRLAWPSEATFCALGQHPAWSTVTEIEVCRGCDGRLTTAMTSLRVLRGATELSLLCLAQAATPWRIETLSARFVSSDAFAYLPEALPALRRLYLSTFPGLEWEASSALEGILERFPRLEYATLRATVLLDRRQRRSRLLESDPG